MLQKFMKYGSPEGLHLAAAYFFVAAFFSSPLYISYAV